MACDARGLPLAVAACGANVHDSQDVQSLSAIRSRRGPRRRRPDKVRAEDVCYSAESLARLRERGIVSRIARPGVESEERLGRRRGKVERLIARLFGQHRPSAANSRADTPATHRARW
ncbi:hypothetical protein ACWCPT_10055 [Streptomyces sp. NPDC002308]